MGLLVWVRKETMLSMTCRKLNPKWEEAYKVLEVLLGGSAYVLKNLFTGRTVQRAAVHVKPYHGSEEWLIEPPGRVLDRDPDEV